MLMAMGQPEIPPAWQYVLTIPQIPPVMLLVLMRFGVISLPLWQIWATAWIGTFLAILIFVAWRVIRGSRAPVSSHRTGARRAGMLRRPSFQRGLSRDVRRPPEARLASSHALLAAARASAFPGLSPGRTPATTAQPSAIRADKPTA
jgi:hypothetical protein